MATKILKKKIDESQRGEMMGGGKEELSKLGMTESFFSSSSREDLK